MKRLVPWFTVLALALSATAAQATATLLIDGSGELIGADDVQVGVSLYDVRFVDGVCSAIFTGCDDASDFTFGTAAAAELASQALFDQVFLDVPGGSFDTAPALTLGCEVGNCSAITPWGVGTAITAWNYPNEVNDSTGPIGFTSSSNTAAAGSPFGYVWAVWTLVTPNAVSEPSSLFAAAAALGALGVVRRRRR